MIAVNEPLLCGNEKKYVLECLDSGWIGSDGAFVRRFEEEFAAKIKRRFAIAVSNGTTALDIAIESLCLKKGDEIIMPSFTIISCVNNAIRLGLKPVFIDCEADSWNINCDLIESAITPRTRAIMMVHIYGLPCDYDRIYALAQKYSLRIIEDAAQSHGQTYASTALNATLPCGSLGDISTFSFYPNKHITTGEGGMIVTNDETLAAKCASLRNLCFEPTRRFLHHALGYNARMSNIAAAIGLAQLENLEHTVAKKREMGAIYARILADLGDSVQLPLPATPNAENVYWVFGLVLKERAKMNAREIMQRLAAKGIGTRPFFYPLHLQPVFNGAFSAAKCPVSEHLGEFGFYIPSGLSLSCAQMNEVATKLKEVLC